MPINRKQTALTVQILGRDYSVLCPEDERESLLCSAKYLARRMAAIQRQGKTLGTERIAMIAALNIARDLLELRREIESRESERPGIDEETGERLAKLQLSVESALNKTG